MLAVAGRPDRRVRLERVPEDRTWRLLLATRIGLLAFCATLVAILRTPAQGLPGLLVLITVAAVASAPLRSASLAKAQPVLEGVVAAAVIANGEQLLPSLAAYLVAPALAAGLTAGSGGALITGGLAALSSMLTLLVRGPGTLSESQLGDLSRWLLTMLAVGLLAAWVRRIKSASVSTEPVDQSYVAAYRLISQLRVVSRQLSRGLDAVSIGQSMLQSIRRDCGFDRGAIYVHSAGGLLVPLAVEGADRLDWPATLDDDSLFGEVWASEEPRARPAGMIRGTEAWSAAIPLRFGLRTFGLVGLEDGFRPFDADRLRAAADIADEESLRLETALLFADVRSIATAEERHRVAREIHDGIAQELASLGYVVDDLAARSRDRPDVRADLQSLRAEFTRVITELRLSIFDLRIGLEPGRGLGSALSDYVRQVGAQSGLTVHLLLDESPVRLGASAEVELLRIAQEAVTNARRHALATNLWVECRVDPPCGLVRVEDDGVGVGKPRADSFGIEVMHERAERIGARLVIAERPGGGTSVVVAIGDGTTLLSNRSVPFGREGS